MRYTISLVILVLIMKKALIIEGQEILDGISFDENHNRSNIIEMNILFRRSKKLSYCDSTSCKKTNSGR